MSICLLTSTQLFSDTSGDSELEKLWWQLNSITSFQVLQVVKPHKMPEIGSNIPNCIYFNAHFTQEAVSPFWDDVTKKLCDYIQKNHITTVICPDENLLLIICELAKLLPSLKFVFFKSSHLDDSHQLDIYRNIFDHILEGGTSKLTAVLPKKTLSPPQDPIFKISDLQCNNLIGLYEFNLHYWHESPLSNLVLIAEDLAGKVIDNTTIFAKKITQTYYLFEVRLMLPKHYQYDDITVKLRSGDNILLEWQLTIAQPISSGIISISSLKDEKSTVLQWTVSDPNSKNIQTVSTQYIEQNIDVLKDQLGAVLECDIISDPKLLDYKDIHKGETMWLIGNGPSVDLTALDYLQGQLSICFNRFYMSYPNIEFRPTYTLSGDIQMIEDFGSEIINSNTEGSVFFAHSQYPVSNRDKFTWLRNISCYPAVFSPDASKYVTAGGASAYAAMQLGYFMGVRKFAVYGMDYKFDFQQNLFTDDRERSATGEGNHFIPGYRSGNNWSPPEIKNIMNSFLLARLFMEEQGGEIINTTPGGNLEVFNRENLYNLVEKN